jgi:hypothetical protein
MIDKRFRKDILCGMSVQSLLCALLVFLFSLDFLTVQLPI